MTTEAASVEIAYRTELVRKAIHLFSLTIPIVYFFIPRDLALVILLPVTAAFVLVDIGRYYHPLLRQWFTTFFGWLLRRHESDDGQKRLNGASYVLISATVCVFLFPKMIMITAFCVLVIGDLTAALIGRRFGRHKFFNKSLEGSSAFVVSGLLILFAIPGMTDSVYMYLLGAGAVILGAFVEALPWEVDDNFSIPIAVGLALWAGEAWLLPLLG